MNIKKVELRNEGIVGEKTKFNRPQERAIDVDSH